MWVLGVVSLIIVIGTVCAFVARREDQGAPDIWDIGGTARTYTTIVGTLEAFSVTSSVFIANLTVARQSAAFESVMALFLIAFLVFISAAIQFGTTPNLSNPVGGPYRVIQNYSYLLANAGFYIGLSLSWLGLPLLLAAVGLDYLADVFIWLVLIAVLGGAIRISSSGLNILGRVDFVASLSLPVICFSGACFYRLGLDELWGDVLPSVHGTAMFAVLCFAVGAIGFSLQSALVGLLSRQSLSTATTTWGRLVLLPYTGAVFTSTSLLWLAVKAQP